MRSTTIEQLIRLISYYSFGYYILFLNGYWKGAWFCLWPHSWYGVPFDCCVCPFDCCVCPLQTTKAFLPWMVENNYGYIISVASVLAFTGVSGLTDYCSSKAAVLNFTESLRCELIGLKKNGITVTCVCPYHVDTEMFAGVRTRFPGILKTLKPSAVADRTVKAVVRRDALVIMPSYFRLLIILKWYVHLFFLHRI